MGNPILERPLVQKVPLLKGLIAGSFLFAGAMFAWGLPVQVVLFFLGLFIFVDACIPDGEVSIIATVLAAALGGLISLVGAVVGFASAWIILMVIALVAHYLRLFPRRKKHGKQPWKQ